jgi:hypothetical protein
LLLTANFSALFRANPSLFDFVRLGAALALVLIASLFEPTRREGKPTFAHERAVA